MSRSLARLFPNGVRNLSLGPVSCSTASSSVSASSSLPPLRYHVFKEPLPYPVGLKLQNDIIDRRLMAKSKDPIGSKGLGDVVLLLEHTPTYTTGRRDNTPNPNELHPEEKKVQNVGASFFITKRGGQVTYHGPGQLVGYPILDLNVMETPTRCYVEFLQAMLGNYIRDTSALDNVLAPHPDGHVGVFSSPTEKVASIGIHLRHRITSHGFAMNVTPEPIAWFDLVMACGLADVRAVSLHNLITRGAMRDGIIPSRLPSVQDVAKSIMPRFGEIFGREIKALDARDSGEAGEVWGLVQKAEQDARKENAKHGGWSSEPDLSQRA
ncbi:lipoyl(octanoyl) transferase [Cryptococcus neoformans C23]|uniref:lipoyl(octanoyl) transferase n=2 Tax=Cryptococcus neoformans TaxID=5207 RepID=A0A854Q9P3_CRYNE|nr:lipoyl(octanoyl) transferase [Cryptococcus neoformans var. grubii H99]AUB26647.1 lipoyl(octanoyl) transferase [Cryptococcus neoformans var. grubii]OWZ41664.1 lipoyl(octanoyl) transferase [Cryptococcus neoformans var. grubii C23]OWZ77171.1 lipoyl(octanoyl) transferase [Cryptococcus neoformans var. grubii Bt85]OXG14674.1 lipoyl(octanoyl) transferase [Cryptococcus neoformans var. grubii Tu401-1]OXG16670.1 lipoyl(octanoyl) transferase [Cryptococcus neoformans var. grubii Tu259-1]OXG19106.1 lip|eukprot:XP_012051281.1 lipoyl(octanoyl) transferase [Cryptococcus neoformans var. grubii H99]